LIIVIIINYKAIHRKFSTPYPLLNVTFFMCIERGIKLALHEIRNTE